MSDYTPIYSSYPYKLDDFQIEAMKAIDKDINLIATAHTGAGKTTIGDYRIAKSLQLGNTVIYTAPIKTLSNQKYNEFSKKFGSENVGILTGDIKVNPLAKILIMTTEILRNSLYRKPDEIHEFSFDRDNVDAVIFDEVHYINDRDRGSVWEETITNLPKHINLIMLSATIEGVDKLVSWIETIKERPIKLVSTSVRPIPLNHYLFWDSDLHKILDNETDWDGPKYNKIYNLWKKNYKNKLDLNILFQSIKCLNDKKRLPAIYFVLNRNLLEKLAKSVSISLITPSEAVEAEKIFNFHLHRYKHIEKTEQKHMILNLIQKGVAVHHSGIMPQLKEIVEILFTKGFIKVLFATETFAVGVNAPTKSVVFTSLTKFDGRDSRYLVTHEYKQMSGRAGRRGLDIFGDVIILPLDDLPHEQETRHIAIGSGIQLSSKFKLDYGLLLKLLNVEPTNDINKITKKIENTYFGLERDVLIKKMKISVDQFKFSNEFTGEEIDILNKWTKIKEGCKGCQHGFSISTKAIKEFNKKDKQFQEKHFILEKRLEDFTTHLCELQNLSDIQDELKYQVNLIHNQIKYIFDYLQNINYININGELTHYGIVAHEFSDQNCIFITEVIRYGFLKNLDIYQIGAIMSVFICDEINGLSIEDIDIDNTVKQRLKSIKQMGEEIQLDEDNLNENLSLCIYNCWDIKYNLVVPTHMWIKGKSWAEVSQHYGYFEGNFIRHMLRLVNLFRNLIIVCKINKDNQLLEKIENIESLIFRDIVTVDSLYVN
jgi:superfamily II RNA helicase